MKVARMQLLPDSISPEVAKAAPGVIASLIALRWVSGTPVQRVGSFFGGASGSYYLTDWLAAVVGMEGHGGALSWLIGMFSMAVAHKVFGMIDSLDLTKRVNEWLTRRGW